jgi:hypothetical protein
MKVMTQGSISLRIIGFVLLCAIFTSAGPKTPNSADAVADLQHVNESYKKHQSLSMNISLKYYPSPKATQPTDKLEGFIWKKGDELHARYGSQEVLCTYGRSILIDHDQKKVVIKPQIPVYAGSLGPLSIDSLFKRIVAPQLLENTAVLKTYTFKLPGSEFKEIRITFRKSDYLLSRLQVIYRTTATYNVPNGENTMLEIDYTEINPKPVFKPQTFAIEQFVTLSKNGFKLTKGYRGYTLLDYNSLGK